MKKQFLLSIIIQVALLWLLILLVYLSFDFIAKQPHFPIFYAILGTVFVPVMGWTQFKRKDKNSERYLSTVDAELPVFKASALLKTSKSFNEIKENLIEKGYDIVFADAEKKIICFSNKNSFSTTWELFYYKRYELIGARLHLTDEKDFVNLSYFPLTEQFPSNKVAKKVSAKFLSELQETLKGTSKN